MSSKRHFVLALVAGAVVFVIGFSLLVWPAMSRAGDVSESMEDLDHKNRTLEERTALVHQLAEELEVAKARAARMLKHIPDSPEIAELVDHLSMAEDGYHMVRQTFTTGRDKEAATDESVTARARPLTVDLVARYSAVLDIIRRAEASDRLIRVTSMRMHRHPDESSVATDDDAVLIASITLEAIYDPTTKGSRR